MNYKQSKEILEEIKKSKRILINCHFAPDYDSIAGCVSLYQVINNLGKDVSMFSPSSLIRETFFLKDVEKVKVVNIKDFRFEYYDLVISLDSQNWTVVTGDKKIPKASNIIKIDHHPNNDSYGRINLVDSNASSVCEILYLMIMDWKQKIDKTLATKLLVGIIGDTGSFQYNNTTERTLKIAGELKELGAENSEIVYKLYRSMNLDTLHLWAEYLKRIKVDSNNKFAWSAIDFKTFKKYRGTRKSNSTVASLFIRVIGGTDFGVTMTEYEKGKLSLSFRERNGFDVSKIAADFGGGGHKSSAGAEIHDLPYKKAVEKVLRIARKHAKKGKK